MKKTILFTLLLILFLLPANFSQAALIEINEQNFPSQALRDFAGKIDHKRKI